MLCCFCSLYKSSNFFTPQCVTVTFSPFQLTCPPPFPFQFSQILLLQDCFFLVFSFDFDSSFLLLTLLSILESQFFCFFCLPLKSSMPLRHAKSPWISLLHLNEFPWMEISFRITSSSIQQLFKTHS